MAQCFWQSGIMLDYTFFFLMFVCTLIIVMNGLKPLVGKSVFASSERVH